MEPSAIMSSILSISGVNSETPSCVSMYRSGISAPRKSGKKSAAGVCLTTSSTAQQHICTSVNACTRVSGTFLT